MLTLAALTAACLERLPELPALVAEPLAPLSESLECLPEAAHLDEHLP